MGKKMKITTKYDKSTLIPFFFHHNLKKKWLLPFVLLLNGLCIFYIISMMEDGYDYRPYMVALIAVDLLYVLGYLVMPFIRTHAIGKKGIILEFELGDGEITFSRTAIEGYQSGYYNYDSVRRLERDRHNYYLYITKREAIILSRAGIEGDEKDLEAFLLAKLGKSRIKFRMS